MYIGEDDQVTYHTKVDPAAQRVAFFGYLHSTFAERGGPVEPTAKRPSTGELEKGSKGRFIFRKVLSYNSRQLDRESRQTKRPISNRYCVCSAAIEERERECQVGAVEAAAEPALKGPAQMQNQSELRRIRQEDCRIPRLRFCWFDFSFHCLLVPSRFL